MGGGGWGGEILACARALCVRVCCLCASVKELTAPLKKKCEMLQLYDKLDTTNNGRSADRIVCDIRTV